MSGERQASGVVESILILLKGCLHRRDGYEVAKAAVGPTGGSSGEVVARGQSPNSSR
jgi:hypothetical protein